MAAGETAAAKSLIERYLKLLFGFSISFAPFSREQAFSITVASFVRTLQQRPQVSRDGEWMQALFREVLAQCAQAVPAGSRDHRSGPLKTVQEALFQLSAADKALVLFRDQCHLPFGTITTVLGTASPEECRLSCMAARERLRNALKEMLEGPRGDNHGV